MALAFGSILINVIDLETQRVWFSSVPFLRFRPSHPFLFYFIFLFSDSLDKFGYHSVRQRCFLAAKQLFTCSTVWYIIGIKLKLLSIISTGSFNKSWVTQFHLSPGVAIEMLENQPESCLTVEVSGENYRQKHQPEAGQLQEFWLIFGRMIPG